MTGPRSVRGFSLIELMIGMIAGLILSGAVISLVVVMSQANTQALVATRLSQEVRALVEIVSRDIRRAGAQALPLENVGTGTDNPPEVRVEVAPGGACIQFTYDIPGEDPGRTFAVRNGALFFASGDAPPACGDAGIRLSTPQIVLTLGQFDFDPAARDVVVRIEARLASDSAGDVVRGVEQVLLLPALEPVTPATP